MAQQEEGWPLGLQPLNVRVASYGSISFHTLLTGSPTSSSDFSSDLDSKSTGSFFHDNSITLGSLIGISSILELSRKSIRGRKAEDLKEKKSCKSKTWFFSLCSRDSTDAESPNNPLSLGHLLAVERRAANENRRNQSPCIYAPDELALAPPVPEPNSLFVNGHVAPPQTSPWYGSSGRSEHGSGSGSGYGFPSLFPCMCGQSSQ
ncbi:hypothetical protein HS088_TW02G00480 [Tripterygium wilfordii]|uniref:Uncharacterized protein n=1 Tax=Tripterygium wilfordii TaxID=458696 RepID=A0A7J7DZG4_TRIWF|nr:uncharacterized protein At3g17950-like [Tripterygium wilfordii]KAF5751466.1 hypothetical protein HS088_TW02G00480 [Tripterygium wilfordii]